jgi:hypothetical protein
MYPDLTPAMAVRAAMGEPIETAIEPAGPPGGFLGRVNPGRFRAELADRQAGRRALDQAWGFADGQGMPTEAGYQRIEMREVHQRHMTGADWVGPLSDADVLTITRRMRALNESRAAAERAQATRGPLSPGEMDAWRAQAGSPMRGVPGG